MSRDLSDKAVRVKGGPPYVPTKHRLAAFREEHPEAAISSEMVHFNPDTGLVIFRVTAAIPDAGMAQGHAMQRPQDFPGGYLEKCETKALGRALSALGYATEWALEAGDDDEDGTAPVPTSGATAGRTTTVAPSSPADPAQASASSGSSTRLPATPASAPSAGSTTTAASKPPAGDADPNDIREAIYALLADDPEADDKLPKPVLEQTYDQLQKTLAWLQQRQAERKPFGSSYRDLRMALAEGRTTDDLLGVKNAIGDAHRKTLTDAGHTALMQYHGERQVELAKIRVPAASMGARR